ncbi:MAG: low molecular weight protein arginine phosphatase [Butyricicoccus pullicaecorum]|nr:low molecular weight protein arginine phosphatase [Butyricicoccus pullicaecorum]MDO4668773.1 low molecular weight protein arginine phosphatase [Butyricicoccus pullicaecorum]
MEQIVFICTGNTCRSPMAEGLFRAMNGQVRTGLQAQSAGLFAHDGLPASENAILAAGEYGADLTAHHARQLDEQIARNASYLVCMTAAHYDRLVEKFPWAEDKVFTLAAKDVADPFGGTLETYRACAAQLKDDVAALIENLEKRK